jgi:hypothetical protein
METATAQDLIFVGGMVALALIQTIQMLLVRDRDER